MRDSARGILLVLAASALWGSSGVSAQYLMSKSYLSAELLTVLRLVTSGLILVVVFLLKNRTFKGVFFVKNDLKSLFIFSLAGTLMTQLTFLVTIEKSNAATATILQFLSPIVLILWFSFIKKKFPGKHVALAISTSFIGTLLLITHGSFNALAISSSALLWGLASALSAAFYSTYSSHLIEKYGTLPVVGWSMLISGIIFFPYVLYDIKIESIVVNFQITVAFLYLVIVGTALTFSLFLKGAYLIGSQKASILSCTEPLSSAILSVLLLGINITLSDWFGIALILFSVLLISVNKEKKGQVKKIERP